MNFVVPPVTAWMTQAAGDLRVEEPLREPAVHRLSSLVLLLLLVAVLALGVRWWDRRRRGSVGAPPRS